MIKLRTLIEIAGFPKEHIEEVMKNIIIKIKEDKEIVVLNVSVADTKPVKQIWSSFAEFELEFKSFTSMLDFCFDYTPSYIEIISPQDLEFKSIEMSDFINDLLARLHQYNMVVANLNAENKVLKMKLQPQAEKNKAPKSKK